MSQHSGFRPAILIGIIATAAIVGGVVAIGSLDNGPQADVEPTPTPTPPVTPTASPTATPTDPPTATPTASPSHTANPTANPTVNPTPTATPTPTTSPTPTPSPVATEFQNAALTSQYDADIHYRVYTANGTLINTNTQQGISGVTISIVDATDNTIIYTTTTTGQTGDFLITFTNAQHPTIQMIFAGNTQYLAATSSPISEQI